VITDVQARRMSDEDHRRWVWENRYDDGVKALNEWVDSRNSTTRWMPYVSPVHSTQARVLSVQRAPATSTDWHTAFGDPEERRGFLSLENDDPAAAETLRLVTEVAGLDASTVCPWNAHPFYLGHDRAPDTGQISEGAKHLKLLLREVMHDVNHVVLQGAEAKKCWAVLRSRDARFCNGYRVWTTWSPAPQAAIRESAAKVAEREETWAAVGAAVR
jgi:hypothetical protein